MRCFVSDEDHAFYLHHLARALPRAGCVLHAYCLMDNHVHLLLTPAQPQGCALLMKSVAQLYAHYFNKSHGRTGYLWQGRFKSCLVQAKHYVLACYRYIEMNPVRAGMTRAASDYSWSSFRVNANGEKSPFVTPHREYLQLGATPDERQAVYRDFFGTAASAALVEQIRGATNGGFVLGDAPFKNTIARALGRRVDPRRAGRPPRAGPAHGQMQLAPQK